MNTSRAFPATLIVGLLVIVGLAGPANADLAPPVLLGQVGGTCNTMTIDGDYLYAGEGMSLAVYHLDADTGCPERVSSICLFGTVGEIAIREHLAYVAAGEGGFCVVDVSDPAAPQVLAALPLTGDALEVALGNGIAYVSWANIPPWTGGVAIVDISQPSSPTLAGTYNAPQPVTALCLDNTTLYVAWSNDSVYGCDVLDVTAPASPVFTAHMTEIGTITDLFVANGVGYVTVEGVTTVTVDLSQVNPLAILGPVPGFPSAMVVSGTTGFTITRGYPSVLGAVDVADPANVISLSEYGVPENMSCLAARNGKVYLGGSGSYIQTVDVSNPTSPSTSCVQGTSGYVPDRAKDADRVYVALQASGVDAPSGNPQPPSPGGFWIVDVADPVSPVFRGAYRTLPADSSSELIDATYRISASGNLVCAAWWAFSDTGSEGGLDIVDVSDPDSPHSVGTWSFPGMRLADVVCDSSTAYVTLFTQGGVSYVCAFDLSSPSEPIISGFCPIHNGLLMSCEMRLAHGFLYVGSQNHYGDAPWLDVIDVHDSTALQLVGSCDLSDEPGYWITDLALLDNVAYVLFGSLSSGISVLNISLPTAPSLLNTVPADEFVWFKSLAAEFDRLYVTALDELVRMDITDPTSPVVLGSCWCPVPNSRIIAEDCLLYVASAEFGLQIFDDGRRPLTIVAQGHGTTDPAPGKRPYDTGTQVTITATPEPGYKLDRWEGDVGTAKADNPLVVTVDAKKSVTAVFTEITYTLTTAKQGFGYTDPAPGVHAFVHDTPVTVTATPEQGWRFDHWEGDFGDDASANPIVVTMTGDKSVTAFFVPTSYVLTIATSGQGSTAPEPGVHEAMTGSEISITAQPATGWRFDHWEGDIGDGATSNPLVVAMDQARTVTAVFAQITHTLSIDTQGAGNTSPEPGEHTYPYGSEVTLVAQPALGWQFDHWEGDVGGDNTANPITVTLDQDHSLTAVFVEITFTLSLSIQGQGTISPEPGQYTHAYGTQVALAATPAEGWRFDRWESAIAKANTDNPITVTMDHDQTIAAIFVEDTAGCSGGTGSTSDAGLIGLAALGLWLASWFRRFPLARASTG